MKRKITLLILAGLLGICPLTVNAQSSSHVGEYVPLDSGGISDTESGGSTGSTLTEEERQANATNSTTSSSITQKIGKMISSYQVDNGYVIYQDGGYTFVTEQTISAEELREIIETAGAYNPIGYGYTIPVYTPGQPAMDDVDQAVFQKVISNQLGGSADISDLELSSITKPIINPGISIPGGFDWDSIYWTEWEKNGFGSLEEFIQWLLEHGAKKIRVDLEGGFLDFPNMEIRYEMLDAYLNSTSAADTVDVQYVLEYRIENARHDTLYRMIGQNGENSYTWSFQNQDTGETYGKFNMASSIYHQFMRAGTYRIDIDKEVYKTFCDAFTFSVNEYYIAEETGQVIWKRETKGKNIDPAVPAAELGFRNMVIYDVPAADAMPSMESLDVNVLSHTVTEDMLDQTLPAEGSFRKFYTERIE